jgi:hypothetical protein
MPDATGGGVRFRSSTAGSVVGRSERLFGVDPVTMGGEKVKIRTWSLAAKRNRNRSQGRVCFKKSGGYHNIFLL